MARIISLFLPVFLNTTVCAEADVPTAVSPKDTVEGETVAGGGVMPFPVNETACGLPPPSSLTKREAVRIPSAPGVKITLIVQVVPGARVLPHVVVIE